MPDEPQEAEVLLVQEVVHDVRLGEAAVEEDGLGPGQLQQQEVDLLT